MGTQNRHNVPFFESASLRERKRKAMKIKQKYKISKKGIEKKSCLLLPKVVIDLPFEGRKVEGSWKYRRERVTMKTNPFPSFSLCSRLELSPGCTLRSRRLTESPDSSKTNWQPLWCAASGRGTCYQLYHPWMATYPHISSWLFSFTSLHFHFFALYFSLCIWFILSCGSGSFMLFGKDFQLGYGSSFASNLNIAATGVVESEGIRSDSDS